MSNSLNESKDKIPLYQHIKNKMKQRILSGEFTKGALLPSFRELTNEYGCSLITSKRVYKDLAREGIVKTFAGRGTFVMISSDQVQAEKNETMYNKFSEAIHFAFLNQCSSEEIRLLFEKSLMTTINQEIQRKPGK